MLFVALWDSRAVACYAASQYEECFPATPWLGSREERARTITLRAQAAAPELVLF
jgi:glutathione S-transferase